MDEAPPSTPVETEKPASDPRLGRPRRLGRALVRFLRPVWLVIRDTWRVYLDSRAFDHAASISFFSLISVAPFLILLVSAAGYLAILVGPESDLMDRIVNQVTEALQSFAPVEGETVRAVFQAVIDRRGQFGLFGTVVMLLGASMAFGALEHAMEDIFQVERHRKFLVSRALFSGLLAAVSLVLFLLHYGMTLVDSFFMAERGMTLDEILRESLLIDAILTYLPVPIGFLLILYAPGVVRVRARNAIAGAVLFFVFWETVRAGYAYYVTSLASFSVLYGSLATPILLTLWTFYSANILLFSMSFVAVLEGVPCENRGSVKEK